MNGGKCTVACAGESGKMVVKERWEGVDCSGKAGENRFVSRGQDSCRRCSVRVFVACV